MLPKEIWFWFHEDLVITASQKQTKVRSHEASLEELPLRLKIEL